MIQTKEKKCCSCKKMKDISNFYRASIRKDGFQTQCKECSKNYSIKYYKTYEYVPNDKRREWQRAYYIKNKETVSEHNEKMYKKYPLKRWARSVVSNYKAMGKIKSEPCEVCCVENTQAHHTDYRKPLDVKWLCIKHHREEDYKLKAGLLT